MPCWEGSRFNLWAIVKFQCKYSILQGGQHETNLWSEKEIKEEVEKEDWGKDKSHTAGRRHATLHSRKEKWEVVRLFRPRSISNLRLLQVLLYFHTETSAIVGPMKGGGK